MGPYDALSILRHRPDQRGAGLDCASSAGGAPGWATAHHQPSCRPQRHLLPLADRLPVATVATRISTVRNGLPLLSSLAKLRWWVHLHRVLCEQARRHAGRAACPSVVIMDGQSVKTTERGGARGFDAHKRVKGRKRHILVDTLGLLVANRVEPADTSDRRAGSAAWGIECVVSENPDDNSRCRPRKPQARSNPEATPRMAVTDCQETTTSVQDHGSDLDR